MEPTQITTGPDGALWFTELFGNAIGRITTSGVVTTYPVPTLNSSPSWITLGPDGALWFTEFNVSKIGRITTSGVITEFPVPANTGPSGITTGPDGALWFTNVLINRIGRMTTAGGVTEYPTSRGSNIHQITAGPDGALWFTESTTSSIGRITTAGVITAYPTPTRNSQIEGITTGPDGAIWFTEYRTENNNKIGQAVFQTAVLSATPNLGTPGTEVTLSGSGFTPNESVNIYGNSTSANLLSTAFADGTGSFVVSGPAQQIPYGHSSVVGAGQSSGHLAVAPFTTQARMIATPAIASVGTTITVEGFGFPPNVAVPIDENGITFLGDGVTNAKGTFSQANAGTFTIPVGTPSGPFNVTAKVNTGVFVGVVITVQ